MFQLVRLFEGLLVLFQSRTEIKAEGILKGASLGPSQGQNKFSIINLILKISVFVSLYKENK